MFFLALAVAISPTEPLPPPATRVRLEASGSPRLIGTLDSWDAETLTIRLPGRDTPLTLPRDQIRRLDVSRGLPSRGERVLRGAGVGLAVGAASGFAIGVGASSTHEAGCFESIEGARCGVIGAILAAPFGSAIGAVAGGLASPSAPTGARLWRGAWMGLLPGAALGALACGGGECAVLGAAAGGLSGLAAASVAGERWRRDPRFGVTLLLPPRGVGLAVSIPIRR